MQKLEKQIVELKGTIKDYEDIVDDKDREIAELKETIEGIRDLLWQMEKII